MNLSFRHPIPFKFRPNRTTEFSVAYSVQQARTELRRLLGVNLEKGLVISAVIHFALIGLYYGLEYYNTMTEDAPVVRIRIMKYSELGPPPSITNSLTAPAIGIAHTARPNVGIPVPVPDAEINPELTIATQTEMSQVSSDALGEGAGDGGEIRIEEDVKIENDEPGMNDFVPVEKTPQVIHSEKPVFPDLARRAGMEGFVWVKILVDKNGKPKKAVVIKESGGEMFSEPAIAAAMKYQFTPAVMNSGPVQVWVAIKFNFQLTDKLQ